MEVAEVLAHLTRLDRARATDPAYKVTVSELNASANRYIDIVPCKTRPYF